MSEKEPTKINLSTFLLVLAVIAIIALTCYIYIDKSNSNQEINELKTSISDLQNTISKSQNYVENTQNTNSNVTNNTSSVSSNETNAEYSSTNTNTATATNSKNTSLKTGTYNINEEPVDPGDGSGVQSVKISANNKFSIDLVYGGTTYSGDYTISDDTLICKSSKVHIEEGGTSSKSSNTVFEFKILNNSKIKFSSIKNIDSADEFKLNIGLTYSIK